MRNQPHAQNASAPNSEVRSQHVRDVMRRDFITISQGESLLEALQLMRLARLRHLTIENEGLLVGVLSYRDLQDKLLARLDPAARLQEAAAAGRAQAVEHLTGSAYSIAPEATLAEAASRLERLRVGCLPVVELAAEGLRVVGLLTEMDLLRAAFGTS